MSNMIDQQQFENKTLDLSSAFGQARGLEQVEKNSKLYSASQTTAPSRENSDDQTENLTPEAVFKDRKIFFYRNYMIAKHGRQSSIGITETF